MNKLLIVSAAVAALAAATAQPVFADAKVDCRSGPRTGWHPIEHLTAKLRGEGWTIKKAHPARDCYEVYGRTPEGDNVESFHHPVTLQKILVLKRGRVLFRAPGY